MEFPSRRHLERLDGHITFYDKIAKGVSLEKLSRVYGKAQGVLEDLFNKYRGKI